MASVRKETSGRKIPSAMTIAGSDSGAGAGVQADLKTFAALGVYGTSVLTAITAQNTLAVTAVHEVPTDVIESQIDAVVTDIGADSVKTGMLSSSAIIECVTESLKKYSAIPELRRLVVDPVMVAKSGDSLLREEAVGALRDMLLPMAAVVTPNIPEAETLTGLSIVSDDEVKKRLGRSSPWERRQSWSKAGIGKGRRQTCISMAIISVSSRRPGSTRLTPTAPGAPSLQRWPRA
jgi:hydroxymethylpyrimidine kinase/phosphomethylpyrimidine kinase